MYAITGVGSGSVNLGAGCGSAGVDNPPGTVGDPYFANVASLLHFDGNLTDVKGLTWTVNGTASASGTAKFGTFALTGNDVNGIQTASGSHLNIGTGDMTVECWVRYTASLNTYNVIAMRATATSWTTGWVLYVTNTGAIKLWAYNADRITSTTLLALNTYAHVALVRASGVWMLFIDGVKQGTTYTNATSPDGAFPLKVKSDGSSLGIFGQIDDFRFTPGVARYTETFTPPTAAFPDS